MIPGNLGIIISFRGQKAGDARPGQGHSGGAFPKGLADMKHSLMGVRMKNQMRLSVKPTMIFLHGGLYA